MKFLLNMNMPPSLGPMLQTDGHEARHVGRSGMSQASDMRIVQEARQRGEIVITNDLDYGRILAFESVDKPSVIICRLANNRPERLFSLIQKVYDQVGPDLEQGAIIVIEEDGFRVRRLPIGE